MDYSLFFPFQSKRFPEDFMSQLTKDVYDNLKCQNGTSCWGGDGGISVAFRTLSIHIVADWLMNVNVFIDAYIFSKCSPMLSVEQSKSIAIAHNIKAIANPIPTIPKILIIKTPLRFRLIRLRLNEFQHLHRLRE